MKLVVGLGNPGREYERNRHNAGFRIVRHWASGQGGSFNEKRDLKGVVARVSVGEQDAIALLPLTYMNASGDSIQAVAKFYKIPVKDIIVVYDEMDLQQGTFRVKVGGGSGSHNGLKSIEFFGTDYLRLRIGIGRPPHPEIRPISHVLGNFTDEEIKHWEEQFPEVATCLEMLVEGKVSEAMNRFNRKEKD